MKSPTSFAGTYGRRQRGAVAIMFGLTILVLFGFMALVIDLGRTYVMRTELQNAADAAALAGAKQLDQTETGVTSAVNHAIAVAGQHNFNFSTAVTITSANISVGTCPDDSCMVLASTVTTNGAAVGKTFLKVDIPSGAIPTFFARLPTTIGGAGTPATSTFGRAVAGHYVVAITPIGICAVDPAVKGGRRSNNELTEYGFRRGVAYNIMQLGPLGSNGQPYLLNPVDVWGGPCSPNNNDVPITAPFICTGTSAVLTTVPGNVYGNTGKSAELNKALNSRFDSETCAPQDANVKEYLAPVPKKGGDPSGNPSDWMILPPDPNTGSTLPSQQTISINNNNKPVDYPNLQPPPAQYGVLWSYSRAVRAVPSGCTTNCTAGPAFDLTDWPGLYGITAKLPPTGYPAPPAIPPFPVGTLAAPYNTSSGQYFSGISSGQRDRRVLNIALVNCPASTGSMGCGSTIPVLAIGKFFMQVRSNLPQEIAVEFDGLVEPIPPHEIRLYR